MMTKITAKPVELPRVTSDWEFVSVQAGPSSDLLAILWKRPPWLPTRDELIACGQRRDWTVITGQFQVLHERSDGWQTIELPKTEQRYHLVQPLPGGEYLLADLWPRSNEQPNGDVYRQDGQLLRSFPLGSGIVDLQATNTGEIWVSFHDQGRFSGDPLSRHGVICKDLAGMLRLAYNDLVLPFGVDDVFDCYAMNVTSANETWLWYYGDFPLVRLLNKEVTEVWTDLPERAPIGGSRAFAIAQHQVLFWGGYDNRDRLYRVNLDDSHVVEFTPVDAQGTPIESFWAFGRGSRLYLDTEETLWLLDREDWADD